MGNNVASGDDATMYTSDCYSGILGAAQMGAKVINCSWGSFGGGGQQNIPAPGNPQCVARGGRG